MELIKPRVVPLEFDGWYATITPRLVASLTLMCGDRDTAADAVAEALSRALERWDRVRVMDAPEGWVYRVAVNVWKRRQRRASMGAALHRRAATGGDGTDRHDGLPVEVRDLLDRLPPREREVVVLRLVLGLSQAETARLLGIAEGSVGSALHDARRRLQATIRSIDDDTSDTEVHS
jgi:RNA polymerase sigma factor (sigma-70 family)